MVNHLKATTISSCCKGNILPENEQVKTTFLAIYQVVNYNYW